MLLRFHCGALLIVWLACIYLSQNTFKVSINDVWGFHLFVKVLKRHFVLALFRHLRSSGTFQQSLYILACCLSGSSLLE